MPDGCTDRSTPPSVSVVVVVVTMGKGAAPSLGGFVCGASPAIWILSLFLSRNREQEREKSEKKDSPFVVVYNNVLAFGKEKGLLSLSLLRERVLLLCSNNDEFWTDCVSRREKNEKMEKKQPHYSGF